MKSNPASIQEMQFLCQINRTSSVPAFGSMVLRLSAPPSSARHRTDTMPEDALTVNTLYSPADKFARISYQLITQAEVSLVIYNAPGQQIKVLADGIRSAGPHVVIVDAPKQNGVYFYKLDAKHEKRSFSDIKKIIFVK